jgi:alpha-glucosidase
VQDQYLYGADLLVAPVITEGAAERNVILPGTSPWRCVWTGADHAPGTHLVESPIGRPPVFYRPESRYAALFASLPEVLTA